MKTAINLTCYTGVSPADMVPLVKAAGFDGCFFDATGKHGDIRDVVPAIRREGLIFQSVHAPYGKMNRMWEPGEEGDLALAELISCVEDTARFDVPLTVVHAFIGFGEEHPNDLGVERYCKLVRRAEEVGVRVAFENTEGESYLEAVCREAYASPYAGFCIDVGHEACYNPGKDIITKYGKDGKLFGTHLNDNLGVTGPSIYWHDDAHLLPYDGIIDWSGVASRLKNVGYDGILTMEVTTLNKPGRNTHDRYAALSPLEFLTLAHERVLKLAEEMK